MVPCAPRACPRAAGLDELAPVAVAQVAWVTPAGVELGTLDPFELGFAKCTIEDLKGGDRVMNAQILTQILSGKLTGPVTDTVILNAGAALYVNGTADSIKVRRTAASWPPRVHRVAVSGDLG